MSLLRKLLTITVMAALLLLPGFSAQAKGRGFKDVVRHIEKTYGAKKTKIPFMGLANFAIKLIRPAGVKGFKLAVFEDQDFDSKVVNPAFGEVMRQSYGIQWQPLVQINSKRDGARTFIYAKQSGKKDVEFAIVTFDQREAVVLEAKLNPEAAARFMENPKLMGISLGNSIRGNGAGATASNRDRTLKPDPQTASASSASDSTVATVSPEPSAATAAWQTARPALSGSSPSNEDHNSEVAEKKVEPEAVPVDKNAIRIETRLVNLNVKAMDRKGLPLIDLKPQDFTVYEDGVKQDLSHFKPVNAPLNVILLLDLSGSTKSKRKAMVESARSFIDALPPQDKISIVAFTRKYKPLTEFTTDKKRLKDSLNEINKIAGGTRYYDSMWTALDQLGALSDTRKAIVVLTDGEDESLVGSAPTDHRFEELLDRASEEDVTIYPIYFKPQQDLSKLGVLFGGGSLLGNDKGKAAREQLEKLAEETGGEVINALREENLDDAYRRVAAELHTLYSLAYSPDTLKHNGEYRKVAIRINRDGAMVRTRRGYYDK